jgi:hypothetical protein
VAASDTVPPLVSAAVVPGGHGRASGPTRAVTGSRAQRFLTSTSACAIRGRRTSTSGADVSGRPPRHPLVDVGAGGYERSLDFPARDPAAAARYDRGAPSGTGERRWTSGRAVGHQRSGARRPAAPRERRLPPRPGSGRPVDNDEPGRRIPPNEGRAIIDMASLPPAVASTRLPCLFSS